MKIIKITEQDLELIVKKVLKEQSFPGTSSVENMGYRNLRAQPKQQKTKENINPKNLKLGDGGKSSPTKTADVKVLQQKLMDLKLLKTDSMVPTGYFGKLTQDALDSYMGKEKTVQTTKGTNGKQQINTVGTDSGFILVFSFPDYQPSVENTWMNRNIMAPLSSLAANEEMIDEQSSGSGGSKGKKMIKLDKLGHGGCVVISKDGNATLYEFGRYDSNDYGSVRKKELGKIAKINNGKLTNAEQVAKIAKGKTEGDGPRLAMDVVVRELPNPSAAKRFADVKERGYTIADPARGGNMNCGTYALEVALEGGVNSSFSCFSSPVGVVDHLKPGLQSFTV